MTLPHVRAAQPQVILERELVHRNVVAMLCHVEQRVTCPSELVPGDRVANVDRPRHPVAPAHLPDRLKIPRHTAALAPLVLVGLVVHPLPPVPDVRDGERWVRSVVLLEGQVDLGGVVERREEFQGAAPAGPGDVGLRILHSTNKSAGLKGDIQCGVVEGGAAVRRAGLGLAITRHDDDGGLLSDQQVVGLVVVVLVTLAIVSRVIVVVPRRQAAGNLAPVDHEVLLHVILHAGQVGGNVLDVILVVRIVGALLAAGAIRGRLAAQKLKRIASVSAVRATVRGIQLVRVRRKASPR